LANSSFNYNTATTSAGVIYALNTDVDIVNCSFINNTAQTGDAGVIYYDCDTSYNFPCTYNINSSYFYNNTAYVDGGVYYFDYYKPSTDGNNVFDSSNTA
jgi:hypothetical protein